MGRPTKLMKRLVKSMAASVSVSEPTPTEQELMERRTSENFGISFFLKQMQGNVFCMASTTGVGKEYICVDVFCLQHICVDVKTPTVDYLFQ